MGWEGTDDEEVFPPPIRVDPFPFTPEGRRFEAMERELSLAQAVLKVGGLVLDRSAIQRAKRRARKRRRGTSHPI